MFETAGSDAASYDKVVGVPKTILVSPRGVFLHMIFPNVVRRIIVSSGLGILLVGGLLGCSFRGSGAPPKSAEEIRLASSLAHTISFSGETIGLIARWYTGDTANWQAVLDNNPGVDPKRLKIGQVILVPRQLVVREDPLTKKALGAASATAKSDRGAGSSRVGASPASDTKPKAASTDGSKTTPPAATEEPVTPESVGQAGGTPAAGAARSRDELLKELLEEF